VTSPPRSERARDSYLAHLDTIEVDPDTLEVDDSGTIAHPPNVAKWRAPELGELPNIVFAGASQAELRIEQAVAKGGMGSIHLATQLPLARRVAVKRPLAGSARARAGLLTEALVTGALQHPNVVPVHRLVRDDEGEPLLMMRFIEGTRWSTGITALYPEPRTGRDDPVDDQLRILLQVCNAVELAHAMHVLHLDLKPDNVMLGQFGEVYVLDWGLAVATDENAPTPLPLARDITHVAGTPAYMAPEMAAADGELIGDHTDVYLLGAILHELITGAPPHLAKRTIDALASAFSVRPTPFGDDVPRELASLCQRALSFDPEDRFASVRAFRESVLAFLRHRSSRRTAQQAARRADRLEGMVHDEDALAADHAELVAEARFGFQQALREHPDSEEARDGLTRLVRANVAYYLARDDPRAAAQALDDLPEPDDALRQRVERELAQLAESDAAREREIAELRERARQGVLLSTPGVARRAAILILALVLPLVVLFARRMIYDVRAGYPEAFLLTALFSIILLVNQVTAGAELTEMSRKVGTAIVLGAAMVALTFALGWATNMDFSIALAVMMLPPTAMVLMGGIVIERRMSLAAIPLLMGAGLIIAWPALRGLWLVFAFGSSLSIGGWIWATARGGASAESLEHTGDE
jgi:eukaryotic-like serine/threonine-protein kinase